MRNRLLCIINNYNYARYLPQCLDSALAQSFDLIVVVDDGSGDDSKAIIDGYAEKHSNILPIFKPNGGQLSCFNAAGKHVEEGDLVFFLDADDRYPGNYVDEVVKFAARETADFYFCEAVPFTDDRDAPADARISDEAPLVMPLSSAVTLATQRWIGSPTSAVVITGALFHQLFPYPFVSDWRVRADDVMVFGASILGAKKVYIRSLGIGYRQHGGNLFVGNNVWKSPSELALRKFRLERLFRLFCERGGVLRHPGYLELDMELQLMDEDVTRFLHLRAMKLKWRSLRYRIKHTLFGAFS